jgi:hypothetical protein
MKNTKNWSLVMDSATTRYSTLKLSLSFLNCIFSSFNLTLGIEDGIDFYEVGNDRRKYDLPQFSHRISRI